MMVRMIETERGGGTGVGGGWLGGERKCVMMVQMRETGEGTRVG